MHTWFGVQQRQQLEVAGFDILDRVRLPHEKKFGCGKDGALDFAIIDQEASV